MKKIKDLYAEKKKISRELVFEMEKEFPVGTRVAFMIMPGQVNPSTGVVVSHRGDGYLSVKHSQAKKNSRYSCRGVFFEDAVKI